MRLPFGYELIKGRGRGASGTGVAKSVAVRAQTREAWDLPFANILNVYQPLKHNMDVYDIIREEIPFNDVTIIKLVQLIGNFSVEAEDKVVQEILDNLIKNIKVNYFGQGLHSLLKQALDSSLAKGMGFIEVIPSRNLTQIARVKIARANEMRFVKDGDQLVFGQIVKGNLQPVKLENQDYIHYFTHDLRDGHPQGYSLFYSLPFISHIFTRILNTISTQLWRFGNASYMVVVKPGENAQYPNVKETKEKIEAAWPSIMQEMRMGRCKDLFVAPPPGSDVEARIIGGDKVIMDFAPHTSTILEQLIVKGFPPFFYGIEKGKYQLSTHQNDMIVGRINNVRIDANPIIQRILDTELNLQGKAGAMFEIMWPKVNLMDEVELAKARHLNAAALDKEIKCRLEVFDLGVLEIDEFMEFLAEQGVISRNRVTKSAKAAVIAQIRERVAFGRAARLLDVN